MKRITFLIVAFFVVEETMGALTVSDITARQRYPWNGLVDISFIVSGELESDKSHELFSVSASRNGGTEIPISALSIAEGENAIATVLSNNGNWIMTLMQAGTGHLIWNATTDITGNDKVPAVLSINPFLGTEPDDMGGVLWDGGPYWASCNIGADKPEAAGLYFWWGDTKGNRPSSDGSFSFNFSGGNASIYTYCKSDEELENAGWATSSGVLAPSHDVAHVKLGGSWRMPTYDELYDLRRYAKKKCDWSVVQRNGISGVRIRGRDSYAGHSIFLPYAGDGNATSLCGLGSHALFWSSSWGQWGLTDKSRGLWIGGGSHGSVNGHQYRYKGFSIRAVRVPNN